ncbi:MAG TPA: flagellar basal body P-ring protein FlgI, partial [Vicinamibacterales bacterium]|nr:flagellar basal body P-ring protein FlgI [Vicinamibacterales bacterium]
MAVCIAATAHAEAASTAGATRVKDVAMLQGVSSTPVIGYGLVVGLNKTGDRRQTIFSTQTLANMLEKFGVSVPFAQLTQMNVQNIAAVMVTGELPAYARFGARLDITASSIGDARSLQGGTLLPTPLRGPDGEVRAMAQGALSLGGFGGGTASNNVQVNHLTVGRVPGGAVVQNATPAKLTTTDAETIVFSLKEPDFVSAERVATAISANLSAGAARVVDSATVVVRVPQEYKTALPDLVARIEVLPVDVDAVARVVINERTGTVVVGGAVRIGPAAVAHGNLSVR